MSIMASPQHLLGLMTVTGVVAAYISGVWGIYGHFLVKGRVEPEMKLTSALSLVGLLWFLLERWQHGALATSITPTLDRVAVAMLAGFMVLFWWTVFTTRRRRLTLAFSKDQPEFIYTTGPYRWIRHPFYTAYIIFWLAVAVGAGTWLFALLPASMCFLYWRAMRLEEAKFAESPLSAEYADYRFRTRRHLTALRSHKMSSSNQ